MLAGDNLLDWKVVPEYLVINAWIQTGVWKVEGTAGSFNS